MIGKINLLILKKWTKSFVSVFMVIFVFIAFADIVDGLVRPHVPFIPIVKNFILRIPDYLNKVLPVICIASTIFTVNYFRSTNELVAMISLGYRPKYFILAITVTASIVAVVSFINIGVMDPYTRKIRHLVLTPEEDMFRVNINKGLVRSSLDTGKIWYKGSNYFVSFSGFDLKNQELQDISIKFYDKKHHGDDIITAEKAVFLENKWFFMNGFRVSNLGKKDFPNFESFNKKSFRINEKPEDFDQIRSDVSTLNFISLYKFIKQIKSSGINTNEFEADYYKMFSTSLNCLLLALLPLGLIYSPQRRGKSTGLYMFFLFIFSIVYYMLDKTVFMLGHKGKIDPIISSFLIPSLCLVYIIYNFSSNKKLK